MNKWLALTFVFILVACGDDSASSGNANCEQDYDDGTYATCLPQEWVTIDAETLRQRGVPGDTIVAFQSEVPVAGQFPTVTVTRETLTSAVTPLDYSSASIRAVAVLPGYEEVDQRDLVVAGEKIKLHIFKAKPSESEPVRRFYQVSTAVENLGYSITGTVPVSVEDGLESQIILMLRESRFGAAAETEE